MHSTRTGRRSATRCRCTGCPSAIPGRGSAAISAKLIPTIGAWHSHFRMARADFGLTCTSGAEGKCILFGYHPWEKRDGVPMRDLHRACMHMLRADYGGDDRPTTRNGIKINLYDRFGIQSVDPAPGMRFEAAWGPDGAVCVAHPRIADNVTLEELASRYPRLRGRLGPQACYEDAVRSDPAALIFNQSTVTWRSKESR